MVDEGRIDTTFQRRPADHVGYLRVPDFEMPAMLRSRCVRRSIGFVAPRAFRRGGREKLFAPYSAFFGKRGWAPSYPETTGYIISDDVRLRASQRAWRSSSIGQCAWPTGMRGPDAERRRAGGNRQRAPSPAVFNTGR